MYRDIRRGQIATHAIMFIATMAIALFAFLAGHHAGAGVMAFFALLFLFFAILWVFT